MNKFPLKRDTYLHINDIKERFYKIKKKLYVSFTTNNITNQDLEDFIGLICLKNSTFRKYGDISDYFQEHVRIDSRRYDEELTPSEYWDSNNDTIKKKISKKRNYNECLRKQISQNVKECTNFCPLIFVKLIKLFKAKRILDFSAGWGDRLVGACLCDNDIKSYVGIDPNKRLFTGYKNIIKELLPKSSHHKYEMINDCAEYYIGLINEKFDLVFTSPPYYDVEIYSDDKNQSIKRYSTFDKWYKKFLLKSINLSIDKLKKYGTLAININNFKGINIIEKLKKDIKIPFIGIIYYGNHRCKTTIYQPILIWNKI